MAKAFGIIASTPRRINIRGLLKSVGIIIASSITIGMVIANRISKVPILISIISVLFFVPLILLIILGPIILEYLG